MHAIHAVLLAASYAFLVGALAVALCVRTRAARLVGAPIHAVAAGRAARVAGALAIAAAAPLALALDAPTPQLWLPLVLLALCVQVLRPSFGDGVCGDGGVRRGWHVRAFGELEEWRLTGDHLRFRLFGEWTAVELPAREQERVRAWLAELVGERQSRFDE